MYYIAEVVFTEGKFEESEVFIVSIIGGYRPYIQKVSQIQVVGMELVNDIELSIFLYYNLLETYVNREKNCIYIGISG